jgi:hypothetical protein
VLHSKTKGSRLNPQRGFGVVKKLPNASRAKKQLKRSTKPLKVLTVHRGEEPSVTKPIFKLRTIEKAVSAISLKLK